MTHTKLKAHPIKSSVVRHSGKLQGAEELTQSRHGAGDEKTGKHAGDMESPQPQA